MDMPNSRMGFQTSSNEYLNKLIENIDDRFQEDSMDKPTLANNILNPSKLHVSTSAIITHAKLT